MAQHTVLNEPDRRQGHEADEEMRVDVPGDYGGRVEHPEAAKLNSRGARVYIDSLIKEWYALNAFIHAEDMAMLESNQSAV
jgi:hypothetical protein